MNNNRATGVKLLLFCGRCGRSFQVRFDKGTEWLSLLGAELNLSIMKLIRCFNEAALMNTLLVYILQQHRFTENQLLHLMGFSKVTNS